MNEYETLWWQFNLPDARKVLEEMLALNRNDPDANRKMAFTEYYYYRNFDTALKSIQISIAEQPSEAENYILQGDIYAACSRYIEALESYRTALKIDSTSTDLYYSMGVAYFKTGDSAEAKACWENSVRIDRFNLDTNRSLHLLYVGDKEYEKAYRIWKTDNLIVAGRKSIGNLGRWNDSYRAALADSPRNIHQTMGDLYAEILLYDEARIEYEKAFDMNPNDTKLPGIISELKQFILFRDALKQALFDYYHRRIVLGGNEENTIIDTLMPIYIEIAVLFPEMKTPQTRDEDWFYSLNEKIERRFKLHISYGTADGFFNCHFGYIIGDEMVSVTQWGRTGDLRFVTLKNMENNGFGSWYWNNLAQHGGWTCSGEDAQIERVNIIMDPKYGAVVNRWRDATEKKRRDAIISKYKETGSTFIEKTPCDVLFSTQLLHEFRFKAVDEATERVELISPGRVKTFVMNLLFDHYYNTTTVIHEGQHALDGIHGKYEQWELEYRAKLSEIVYGEMPFLSLSDLMTRDIGNMSLSHGKANTRVFEDIVKYINTNETMFPAIDKDKNILMQLGKLQSEDIKNIARDTFVAKYLN